MKLSATFTSKLLSNHTTLWWTHRRQSPVLWGRAVSLGADLLDFGFQQLKWTITSGWTITSPFLLRWLRKYHMSLLERNWTSIQTSTHNHMHTSSHFWVPNQTLCVTQGYFQPIPCQFCSLSTEQYYYSYLSCGLTVLRVVSPKMRELQSGHQIAKYHHYAVGT